jgi:thiamine biosynthesis lipoprotein
MHGFSSLTRTCSIEPSSWTAFSRRFSAVAFFTFLALVGPRASLTEPKFSALLATETSTAPEPLASQQTPATDPVNHAPVRWVREAEEMAAPLRIICYHPDGVVADRAMARAMARIHQLNAIFNDYDPTSEVRRLCETAGTGKKVQVSDDLWRLLVFSLEISEQTAGAFDVTIGPIVRLWRRARMARELPPAWRFDQARQAVGYQFVRLYPEDRAVELLRPGMRLDFGAVAKGYAIDAALQVMREEGVCSALIDLGGDLGLGDPPPDRDHWNVAVAAIKPGESPSYFVRRARCGVATSGDRYRFVVIDGKRYSHIVDPRTGVGLTDQSEVTVVAPNATLADALATAVSVLGPEKGLAWVDTFPDTAALYLRLVGEHTEVYTSKRWKELTGGTGNAQP